jgi:rod shape-determining protein MreC
MLIFSRYSWWAAAMVALAILLSAMGYVGALRPFQSAFLAVITPFENAAGSVFRPIAGVLTDAGNIGRLRDENTQLRLQNEQLQNQVTSLQQDAEQLNELRSILQISGERPDEKRLVANVVQRDSTPFTDVISIDRGTNDGIKVGMVVLSAQGTLMGSVTDVLATRSFVRLITDTKSKVASEVQTTKFEGIVQGTPGRGLEFALADGDVKVGDTIVTSSLTGRFPAGIPIARVSEVSGAPTDIQRKVKLDPLVRVSGARTVLVITSFLPQVLGPTTP